MTESLKIMALFLWVMGAIYIREDAHQKVRNQPVVYQEQNITLPEKTSDDSTSVKAEVIR